MKITHIALVGILLLVGTVVALLMKSDQDKLMVKQQAAFEQQTKMLQERMDQLVKQSAMAPQATPAPVAPAATEQPAPTPAPAVPTAAAATPPPAGSDLPPGLPAPAGMDLEKLASREKELIAENAASLSKLKEIPPPPDDMLSKMGLRIRKMPALCKIAAVNQENGFVVLDGGSSVGFQASPTVGADGKPIIKALRDNQFCVRRDYMIIAKVSISEVKDATTSIADIDPKSVPLGVSLKVGDEIIKFEE